MLSNAKHILDRYIEHAEHILCTYLQYADYGQWIRRPTLPIGVNDGGKEKTNGQQQQQTGDKKRPVPRAAAAYGRQLKNDVRNRTLVYFLDYLTSVFVSFEKCPKGSSFS